MKTMTPVQRKKLHTCVRTAIQFLFFVLLPSAFTTAFAGVKEVFTKLGVREIVELTSFVTVFVVLGVYTIVFGRFFCGYACAFGSLGDAVHAAYMWVCKKCKKKPITIRDSWGKPLSFVKYIILAVILLLCFMGYYGKMRGTSPWDVFSMITTGNFKLGAYGIGVVLLIVILCGMAICERFFCRFLCPMGAVFNVLPVLPVFSMQRNRADCLNGCSGCKRVCPSAIDLSDKGSIGVAEDCFQCGKCINVCPKQNVGRMMFSKKEFELWFTLVRAILLAIVLVLAGV